MPILDQHIKLMLPAFLQSVSSKEERNLDKVEVEISKFSRTTIFSLPPLAKPLVSVVDHRSCSSPSVYS